MCLAIPAKVLEVSGDTAIVDFGGVKREICIALLENVKPGDYVLVHTGFAIQVIDEEEAMETLRLWEELLSSQQVEV